MGFFLFHSVVWKRIRREFRVGENKWQVRYKNLHYELRFIRQVRGDAEIEHSATPPFTAEQPAPQHYYREGSGSIVSPQTGPPGHPDWCFSSVPLCENFRIILKLRAQPFPYKSFRTHYSLIIVGLIVWLYMLVDKAADKGSNKLSRTQYKCSPIISPLGTSHIPKLDCGLTKRGVNEEKRSHR